MAEGNENDWKTGAFIGIGLVGVGFFGALAAASATLGPAAIPVWALAVGLVAVVVKSPVAQAFAKRMKDDEPLHHELPEDLYVELDDLRARVLELEERQDFAERILADRSSVKEQV